MVQSNPNNKYRNQNNDKSNIKCRYGNLTLYHYKDPYGKTIPIVRPAFVKIKTIE